MPTKPGKPKRLRHPIPLDVTYPSKLEQFYLPIKLRMTNALYPVPPLIFLSCTAGSFVRQLTTPSSYVLQLRALLFGSTSDSRWLRATEAAIFALSCTYGFVFVSRLFVSRFILGYKGYMFEGRKPSLMTKVWAISRKILMWLSPPQLESCEALLPAQPVPSLEGTVKRYLESMEPLMSKEEFEKVCQVADEFVQNEGLKLQFYAKVYSWTVPNYVTPFWERFAYLASRQSLLGNSSLGYADFYTNISLDQARRAACVAYAETAFSLACYREQVRPLGDGLLSTSRYKRCHCQTRVPGKTGDTLVSSMPSRHVAVISKGHIYSVDMFDRKGLIYDLEKVYQIFVDILRQPGRCKNDAASRIPAFTVDRRDKWCENRRRFFLENPRNRASLEIIESATIVITLEEAVDYGYDPKNHAPLDTFMKAMLTGDGGDRWADKCKNYVVSKNGRIGGTTEHSPADGSEFDHARELYSYIETNVQKHPPQVKDLRDVKDWQPPADLKLAKRLDFEVTTEMAKEIERCYTEYQPVKDDIDVATFVFNCFGKGAIKNFKCSPDGFVQMALQLTYFKLHSRFVQTYEPASSRFYRNSRTEALRTVSRESCAFVRAMVDGKTTEEKINLLRAACEMHVNKSRLAMTGKGVDRHLFVLYVISRGRNVKSPFLDQYISQPWTLSTSQAPTVTDLLDEDADLNTAWLGGCFAPVDPKGYGVTYRFAGESRIPFAISSLKSTSHTDSGRFRETLNDYLLEMAALFGFTNGTTQ